MCEQDDELLASAAAAPPYTIAPTTSDGVLTRLTVGDGVAVGSGSEDASPLQHSSHVESESLTTRPHCATRKRSDLRASTYTSLGYLLASIEQ